MQADSATATCIATLEGQPEELYCCDWLQSGPQTLEHLITASGRSVALWDVAKDKPRRVSEVELKSDQVYGTRFAVMSSLCGS
jgi:hypothetical protein